MSFATVLVEEKQKELEENITEELKETSYLKNLQTKVKSFFLQQNSPEPLSCRIFDFLKGVQLEQKSDFIKSAEVIDRIGDLDADDHQQKIASLVWFGEQRNTESLYILKKFLEYEIDHAVKSICERAMVKLTTRLYDRKPNFTEKELKGNFQPNRKPWRAMLEITKVEDDFVWVMLPGWISDEEIKLHRNVFPEKLQKFIEAGEHFFAKVNIGAADQSELYFIDFEDRPKKCHLDKYSSWM